MADGPAESVPDDESSLSFALDGHDDPLDGDDNLLDRHDDLLDHDDALPTGLAVGYGGEDLDDVSPPVLHVGDLPVGFEVDSPIPHLDPGHYVLDGGVGEDFDALDDFDDLDLDV